MAIFELVELSRFEENGGTVTVRKTVELCENILRNLPRRKPDVELSRLACPQSAPPDAWMNGWHLQMGPNTRPSILFLHVFASDALGGTTH